MSCRLRCHALKGDAESFHAVGRLLIRLGQFATAAEWLREAASRPDAGPEVNNWYMEALFETGQYDALRALARGQPCGGEPAPHAPAAANRDPVNLWIGAWPAMGGAHG